MTRLAIAVLAVTALGAADTAGRARAILNRRCLGCHNNQLNDGGISFEDRATLLKGGRRGPAVVPGAPERSFLIEAVRRAGEVKMPPGRPLNGREIRALSGWIKDGAPWLEAGSK